MSAVSIPRMLYSEDWDRSQLIQVEEDNGAVVQYKLEDFTKVSFSPDLKRFNIFAETGGKSVDVNPTDASSRALADTLSVMHRRAVDVAACLSHTDSGVTVFFNGEEISVRSFLQYAELFSKPSERSDADGPSRKSSKVSRRPKKRAVVQEGNRDEIATSATSVASLEGGEGPVPEVRTQPVLYTSIGDRWEVAVGRSTSGVFEHMSFVNCIWTPRWGTWGEIRLFSPVRTTPLVTSPHDPRGYTLEGIDRVL